jgi:hypothetical protein
MTKFFQDYFEHYLSEDEMIEINDLWDAVCHGDEPEDIFDKYGLFDMSTWPDKIKVKLRKTLTIEVAELMKSLAFNRHHREDNPNYHITKDEMMSLTKTADRMQSREELAKITADKFNNDIDKYEPKKLWRRYALYHPMNETTRRIK